MNINEVKTKYSQLIKDINFDRLDLELKNPNIFQILKISNTEIRHSNFLSWLLDPSQSHKIGDIFLKRFLREVFSSDKFEKIDQIDVEGMNLSNVQIYREWKNIDILIVLNETVVCVENKILTKEHSNQLNRYKRIVEENFPNMRKIFVYLTPFGEISENESDNYEPISYVFIVETLERILKVYNSSLNDLVKTYIKDYIIMIKRELMKTDESIELSKKIYQNHKELLDFIYENKPDLSDHFIKILKEEMRNRGWIEGSTTKHYIRFYTEKIKDFIYYNKTIKNGWKKNESFLFEILVYPPTNKFSFVTIISPSDPNYEREKIEKILLEIDGSKKGSGKKWFVNFRVNSKIDYEEVSNLSDDEVRKIINDFFDKISKTVEKVENKFLEYKTELLRMKNVDISK